jgi:hypothetical protein
MSDERGQRGNSIGGRHPVKEELPKGNPKLGTGLFRLASGPDSVAQGAACPSTDIIGRMPIQLTFYLDLVRNY